MKHHLQKSDRVRLHAQYQTKPPKRPYGPAYQYSAAAATRRRAAS